MEIHSVLPYELRAAKTTTMLQVTLPNGLVYTHTLPLQESAIVAMTIDYDETKGLLIYATGAGENTYFETVSPDVLPPNQKP
jgi:hypothetical protein